MSSYAWAFCQVIGNFVPSGKVRSESKKEFDKDSLRYTSHPSYFATALLNSWYSCPQGGEINLVFLSSRQWTSESVWTSYNS